MYYNLYGHFCLHANMGEFLSCLLKQIYQSKDLYLTVNKVKQNSVVKPCISQCPCEV